MFSGGNTQDLPNLNSVRESYHKRQKQAGKREEIFKTRQENMKLLIKMNQGRYLADMKVKSFFNIQSSVLVLIVEELLSVMEGQWKVGLYQNYFLIVLANVLAADELQEEDLGLVVEFARRRIEPDFGDEEFMKTSALFFKRLFERHHQLYAEENEERNGQILNEERFLPMIQASLAKIQSLQGKKLLIESVTDMMAGDGSETGAEVQKHYVVQRNERAIEMIVDCHLRTLQDGGEQSIQLCCFEVYEQSVRNYMQPPIFMDTENIIRILRSSMASNRQKIIIEVMELLESIFRFQTPEYTHLTPFLTNQFLPFIFKKEITLWIQFIHELSSINPHLVEPFNPYIVESIVQHYRTNPNPEAVSVSLKLLSSIWFHELQDVNTSSFDLFKSLQGFEILAELPNIPVSVLLEIEHFLQQQQKIESEIDGIGQRLFKPKKKKPTPI